jgi:adenosine deaminase
MGIFWKLIALGSISGEEGPADELWECINNLKVDRIDHGVSCLQDEKLLRHLKATRLPITVCPLSNYKVGSLLDYQAWTLAFDCHPCIC